MIDLFHEAKEYSIEIEYVRLPENKSISTETDGSCFIFMDYSLLWASAKEHVHMAHEMGHCITGSFYNPYSGLDIRGRHEYRADKWAIKKLVPKDELEEAVHDGYYECWQLAEYFNVTCEFMAKALALYKHC